MPIIRVNEVRFKLNLEKNTQMSFYFLSFIPPPHYLSNFPFTYFASFWIFLYSKWFTLNWSLNHINLCFRNSFQLQFKLIRLFNEWLQPGHRVHCDFVKRHKFITNMQVVVKVRAFFLVPTSNPVKEKDNININ